MYLQHRTTSRAVTAALGAGLMAIAVLAGCTNSPGANGSETPTPTASAISTPTPTPTPTSDPKPTSEKDAIESATEVASAYMEAWSTVQATDPTDRKLIQKYATDQGMGAPNRSLDSQVEDGVTVDGESTFTLIEDGGHYTAWSTGEDGERVENGTVYLYGCEDSAGMTFTLPGEEPQPFAIPLLEVEITVQYTAFNSTWQVTNYKQIRDDAGELDLSRCEK